MKKSKDLYEKYSSLMDLLKQPASKHSEEPAVKIETVPVSMEGANRIDALIKQLCPNGVEYKKLGDIAFYVKDRVDASSLDEDNYVGVDNLLPNRMGKKQSVCVPEEGKFVAFNVGDILLGNIRPYLKKIWLADCSGGTNGDVLVMVNFHSKCKMLGGVAEFFSEAFLCRFPPEDLPRPVVYPVHSLPV